MEISEGSVKKLILMNAVLAEIEGMKAANRQHPDAEPYGENHFFDLSDELNHISYLNDWQILEYNRPNK